MALTLLKGLWTCQIRINCASFSSRLAAVPERLGCRWFCPYASLYRFLREMRLRASCRRNASFLARRIVDREQQRGCSLPSPLTARVQRKTAGILHAIATGGGTSAA